MSWLNTYDLAFIKATHITFIALLTVAALYAIMVLVTSLIELVKR